SDTGSDTGPDYWIDGYCPQPADGIEQKVSNDCKGLSFQGCCDGAGNVIYCYDNALYCKPCAPQYACSWYEDDTDLGEPYYWCTASDNGSDPAGVFPMSCNSYGIGGDTDTALDIVPECTKEPVTCSDIDANDTDMQIYGCCWNNIAHYCIDGDLYYSVCAETADSRCGANLYTFPPGADCITQKYEPPSNPFDCGGTPLTCSDISPDKDLQPMGCCQGSVAWYCDLGIQTEPISADCSATQCNINYVEISDTDNPSDTYTLGYMGCRAN
ncbi:MAG: hypothetical protein JXR91_10005, partial [Deltaproteobacteria bacterium]|nr:hypothetical protein [Deltaproteobacteria bacterium]